MNLPRLVVLASGSGSNFEAIVEASLNKTLHARIAGLICNKEGALVLQRAERLEVPVRTINRKSFATSSAWNAAIRDQLIEWSADWVALAGYTGLIGSEVLKAFPNRIINIHPSLLPKFGGKGMYGDFVHEAVIAANEKRSGVTVHLIDDEYDKGPIVAQHEVEIPAGCTAQSLAELIKSEERKFYPKVLNDLLTGRIKLT